MVVEVFDERKVYDDILKRDEIGRPKAIEGTSGVRHDSMGVGHDNLGVTRGNLNKDNSEQSLTEVVVDDGEGDHGTELDKLSDEGSTQRDTIFDKSKLSKPSLPLSLNIPDIDKDDLENLRNLIVMEKSSGHSNNYNNTSNVHTNVAKESQNNKIAKKIPRNDNNLENKMMEIHNLDTVAEKYGIKNENSHFINSAHKNNEFMNYTMTYNNSNNNANNNNNSNTSSSSSNNNSNNNNNNNNNNSNNNSNNNNNNNSNNSSSNNNSKNKNNATSNDNSLKRGNASTDNSNANNDSDELVDSSNEIQELLLNSLGSLKSKEKGISDDQLAKLKETVHDFLTKSNSNVSYLLCHIFYFYI